MSKLGTKFWEVVGKVYGNRFYKAIDKAKGKSMGTYSPFIVSQLDALRGSDLGNFFGAETKKYYSQSGQDFFVDFIFGSKSEGVFLDIGGNDPVSINNTYWFEEKGWTGLAFEPLAEKNKLWAEKRKTPCLEIALGQEEKKVIFAKTAKDYLSKKYEGDFIKNAKTDSSESQIVETFEVQQRRLSDVLDEYDMHEIDYISLDVEGAEMEVLQGIDWEKTLIKVLSIEAADDNKSNNAIRKYMISKGFMLLARLTFDDIWVNRKVFKSKY